MLNGAAVASPDTIDRGTVVRVDLSPRTGITAGRRSSRVRDLVGIDSCAATERPGSTRLLEELGDEYADSLCVKLSYGNALDRISIMPAVTVAACLAGESSSGGPRL